MTIQQKILDAIKTATSQKPVGILALIDQLKIDGDTMADELETLYNSKRINRCMHTKDGVTQQVVWPTNVVATVTWGAFEISKPKAPVTPIRTQLTKQPEATPMTDKRPLAMLQAVCNAPQGITTQDIRKQFSVADVIKYFDWYITNGYILKTGTGRKGNWLLQLNPDHASKTAEQIYQLRKPAPKTVDSAIKAMTDAAATTLVANIATTNATEPTASDADIVAQADNYLEQILIEQAAAKLNNTQDNNPLQNQVGGDHYKKLGIYQPWEVLARWLTPEELRGYAKGTVIAYLARERDKGGDADIAKSLHTLELFEHLKNTNVEAA